MSTTTTQKPDEPIRSRNEYIRSTAIEIGFMDFGDNFVAEYWITPCPGTGSLNGYLAFPFPVLRMSGKGFGGVLGHIPVHWGPTYNQIDENRAVYGFDTSHCDSHEFPRHDPNWIKSQLGILGQGLKIARKLERAYQRASLRKCTKVWKEKRRINSLCRMIDTIRAVAPGAPLSFHDMLFVLSGAALS